MSNKKLIYIGFFAVLVLAFYFILTQVIPGFGEKKKFTISYVKPFRFTNQDGQPVTDKDMAGKVYIVEYFFTNCGGICPVMNKNMKRVYEELKQEKDFLILSHTSDPERDSVGQMKYFSDSMGVDTKKWIFLTGRKDSLYNMARVSYMIDDPANNLKSIEDQFVHSQFWALVDRNGDVKKVYDALKESEVKEVIKDAKELLKDTD